jgi:HSP20 family protein
MSTTMPVNEQNQAVSSCAPQQSKPVVAPPADVFETESALTMLLSIPGATAESVQITLHRNKLTISADANFAIPQGMKLTYAEFAPCTYERSFMLSEGIDTDAIEASVANGTLKLVLPKSASARIRKIPFNSE